MSLFRKPKRRPPTKIGVDDDSEEETGRDQTQNSTESHKPNEDRPKKKDKGGVVPRPLLSFVDEVEDDSDTFRVKKSSHSKKLQKRKDRERRTKSVAEQDSNGRPPDQRPKNNQKKSIEGIILSGREALAAGTTGDLSCSDEEDNDENDRPTFRATKHTFRSQADPVREILDRGAIPDAAMIHAARKKRQQAREIGDFIPVDSTVHNSDVNSKPTYHPMSDTSSKKEGRLVREDGAGDGSDEDPDRIHIRGVAPETTKKERIQLAKEEGQDSDLDSGGEEWETQQIRKAVTHNQIIAVQQETYYGGSYVMPTVTPFIENDTNPFSMAPISVGLLSFTSDHLKPLVSDGATPSINQLTEIFEERLSDLVRSKQNKLSEISDVDGELIKLQSIREMSSKKAPALASRFEFYQKLRAYLTDLIECLDEKLPDLNVLEARAMTLQKRKASFLCERRRSDIRDQAQDILQAAGGVSTNNPENEERRRRCAEREGRRLRRRRKREQLAEGATPCVHRDGDSTDDEIPQTETAAYETIQEQIITETNALFSDTLDDFSSLASVLSHLENWRDKDFSAYIDAYVSLCIPRLAAPFLRLKLLSWNPITDETAPEWSRMQWYRGLMLYGLKEDAETPETQETLAMDPDIYLIPNIIQKVILPKLAELIDGTWDPLSTSQTKRLASLLKQAGSLPGASPTNQCYTDLAKAVLNRIKLALQHDVFIPILPKSVVDSGPRSGSVFLKRQAIAGIRLLNNMIHLHGTIADNSLAPLALEALLQRYLLAAIRCSPPAFGAELSWLIATCLPKTWLEQESSKPPLQQFTICCQEVLSGLVDNVMNLKFIKMIRSAISILSNESTSTIAN